VQRRFYELTGDLPPRRSSWDGSDLVAQRGVAAYRAQLEQMYPLPEVPEWERIKSAVTVIEERAARALLSPEAAAVELDRRTDRILEKRRWILERGSASSEHGNDHRPSPVGALP